MKPLGYYLKNHNYFLLSILAHCFKWLPDKAYLKMKFPLEMGYSLNLKSPKTFAEKLQWLKLNDRKPIYHKMVDKVEAKRLIDSIIGPGYTIPTIGVYGSFEEIDWDNLPQRFILKATHDSGSFYIVNDKNTIDIQECKKRLYVHWNDDYYRVNREWQYKGIKSRIIAEPLIADPKQLREYKFFCFNGEPKLFQTCSDRDYSQGGAFLHFYDMNCEKLDIHDKLHSRYSEAQISKPEHLDLMVSFSRLLSKDTCFMRVDFYEVADILYLGELTLHENAGFCSFSPDIWNRTMGDWIKLPINK